MARHAIKWVGSSKYLNVYYNFGMANGTQFQCLSLLLMFWNVSDEICEWKNEQRNRLKQYLYLRAFWIKCINSQTRSYLITSININSNINNMNDYNDVEQVSQWSMILCMECFLYDVRIWKLKVFLLSKPSSAIIFFWEVHIRWWKIPMK